MRGVLSSTRPTSSPFCSIRITSETSDATCCRCRCKSETVTGLSGCAAVRNSAMRGKSPDVPRLLVNSGVEDDVSMPNSAFWDADVHLPIG